MAKEVLQDEKKAKVTKPAVEEQPANQLADRPTLTTLQNQIGNQAVQRLIAQRSGDGPTELDDETAGRINGARGGGQALDESVQTQMGQAMGRDFGGVRVHTSSESDGLNQQLGAKAFTTGQDIFFREGAYDPHSGDGQELIAHELTHVVQQSSGAVGSGGRMMVNAPDDAYEQEADSVAKTLTTSGAGASVQRQTEEEEEEPVQMQAEEEEEEVQMQAEEEEEEPVQMQAEEEEEEVI